MRKKENSKSLMIGVPGIVLQMVGNFFKPEDSGGEGAILCGLLMLAGTVLLIWGLWYYAKSRDRSGYWSLCGLLSCIGIIILACLRDKHATGCETTPLSQIEPPDLIPPGDGDWAMWDDDA
ncbi:MAG: hypothetical protein VX738_12180 [Planctomycetota bacterium]|nr:hypothetical protein [Planctomycetota bacterium]